MVITPDPGLFFFINQGCLTVDNMDDVEEMKLADVRTSMFLCCAGWCAGCVLVSGIYNAIKMQLVSSQLVNSSTCVN